MRAKSHVDRRYTLLSKGGMTMLKPDEPAFAQLRAALKDVASSRYAEEFLWSVDDTTVWTRVTAACDLSS